MRGLDPASASPSSDAIAHLTALYERTVPPRPDIACRKGCGYCCTQPVIVSAPEAFFVAAQLRKSADKARAVVPDAARITASVNHGAVSEFSRTERDHLLDRLGEIIAVLKTA